MNPCPKCGCWVRREPGAVACTGCGARADLPDASRANLPDASRANLMLQWMIDAALRPRSAECSPMFNNGGSAFTTPPPNPGRVRKARKAPARHRPVPSVAGSRAGLA